MAKIVKIFYSTNRCTTKRAKSIQYAMVDSRVGSNDNTKQIITVTTTAATGSTVKPQHGTKSTATKSSANNIKK